MSIETWKDEFYGKPDFVTMSTLEALMHSLRKWAGLRVEHLNRHDVRIESLYCGAPTLIDDAGQRFRIAAASCALCANNPDCRTCPLYKPDKGDTCADEYEHFCRTQDPVPMIITILLAIEREITQPAINTKETE